MEEADPTANTPNQSGSNAEIQPDSQRPGSADPDVTCASAGPQPTRNAAPTTPTLPLTIGRYRITRLLGEGGMGSVYEAEQEQPRRRVALKLIKTAWAGPELLRRFELEFQALGRLHHPGIAQIYEAGSAETAFGSQPFFAMELIQGKPLVDYANAHRLNTRQRLELMIKICEAVEHAHQRGIIHRDLKPGNILVDEGGQPKILDFGLARVTDGDVQATRQTDMGQLLGTLAYMSPEQVIADPLALDTRTDVYALGVILYELLAGKLPYQVSRQVVEMVKTIQQVDPTRLSSLNRAYRGDVETIVAKALEKDKTRRYGSAAELAADLRRHLDDRPIAAKPASTSYQLQKFARRNKVLVAGIGAVFLTLVIGVVVSTWQAVRARRAEARAQSEAATAQAVVDFLQNDMLAQASSSTQASERISADPDIKVRTALDRAAQRIEGKFKDQPEVEAAIRQTMGQTYLDLGANPEAQKQLERAWELRRRVLGPENPKTIETTIGLAEAIYHQGKYAKAEELYVQALDISRRLRGPEHPDTLRAMSGLAEVYGDEHKYVEAEPLAKQALEISRRVLGLEHPDTIHALYRLASIDSQRNKYAEAETLESQAFEISTRVLGAEHPRTLEIGQFLSEIYLRTDRNAEAAALDEKILEIQRRTLGPEHPNVLTTMYRLAAAYEGEHQYSDAERIARQRLDTELRVYGRNNRGALYSMEQLAAIFRDEGNYSQSERLYRQAVEGSRRVMGPEHYDTVHATTDLADVLKSEGKYGQAAEIYRQALDIENRKEPLASTTLVDNGFFAILLSYQGQYAKAETQIKEVLTKATQSPDPGALSTAWYNYACLEAVAGHRDKAFEYLQKAFDLGDTGMATMGSDDDLKSLRQDPRFAALIEKAKQRAAHGSN